MKRLLDLSPFDWIERGVTPLPEDDEPWQGHRVSHCVPPQFAAYAKVFHAVYEDPTVSDKSISWHAATYSKQGSTIARAIGATLASQPVTQDVLALSGRRVLWSELAAKYGLTMHACITAESFTRGFADSSWPRYLFGPNEGSMDPVTTKGLADCLADGGGNEWLFYYAPHTTDDGMPRLYAGSPGDLVGTANEETRDHALRGTPTYVWNKDHTLCVVTEWHWAFSVVGGTRKLIRALCAHPQLDAWEVDAATRLDEEADTINATRQK